MLKLIDNKQIIHIATEIIVIVCLTFYFTKKTKVLTNKIDSLEEKIEAQKLIIQQHDQLIHKLIELINEQMLHKNVVAETFQNQPVIIEKSKKIQPVKKNINEKNTKPTTTLPKNTVKTVLHEKKYAPEHKVSIIEESASEKDEEEEEEESDLDAELQEELGELVENKNESLVDLKKTTLKVKS
jgi:hypothetical protein